MINVRNKSIILKPWQITELLSKGTITVKSRADLRVESIYWVKEMWKPGIDHSAENNLVSIEYFDKTLKIKSPYKLSVLWSEMYSKSTEDFYLPSTMNKWMSRFKVFLIGKSFRNYLTFKLIT